MPGFARSYASRYDDTVDGGQTDLGVLVRRNVDASDTCHVRVSLKLVQSALTLLADADRYESREQRTCCGG